MHKGGQYIWNEMPNENKKILFSMYHKQRVEDPYLQDYEELKEIIHKKFPKQTATFQFYFKALILILSTLYVDFWMDYGYGMAFLRGILYALVGFNISHDANHSAVSNDWRVNYIFSFTSDYGGISSFLWRLHHNYGHHVNTNNSKDPDYVVIFPVRKYQNIWLWFLLPFLAVKDHISQLCDLLFKRYKDERGRKIGLFLMVMFWIRFYGVPLYNDIWNIRWIMMTNVVLGVYAGFFFLLSHHFEGNRPNCRTTWMRDQVENSSNVGGRWLCFINGGLNYQIEHHLFPRVCHTYYPELAKVVRRYCEENGIRYRHFGSIMENFVSTCKSMKKMN